MICLWILAILVVFALGLGHRAVINLQLAKYQRDRLKATCLAKAGINRAIVELENEDSTYDSLNDTWSTGKDANNNNIFQDIEIVQNSGESFSVRVTDEDAKININNAAGSKQLLAALLTERNIEDADNLANTIIDWIDENNTNYRGEAENEVFKNQCLTTPEELGLIFEFYYDDEKKVADNYPAIKDYISVYTDGQVNINTSSPQTLGIIAKNINNSSDAVSLAEKIINWRQQAGVSFTQLEDTTDFERNLTPQEIVVFTQMKTQLKVNSGYFKIESEGKAGNTSKKITAIYNRANQQVVYWHEK